MNQIALKYIVATFLISFFSLVSNLFAQKNNIEDNFKKESGELVISLKSYEGKVYINWKENDHSVESQYIILRSIDGEDYSLIGAKKSYKLDNSLMLSYSFIDSPEGNTQYHYKVVRVSDENSELLSSSDVKNINIAPVSDRNTLEITPSFNSAYLDK